ncbi:MAG TPA: DinB family protein [Longimicrobiales bacterium]|nr:DinB family protein [Longimicrobiales bacterium]
MRAQTLADRILLGAKALAEYAEGLDDTQWATPTRGDGRPVGVIVHHVASVYPIEVDLAEVLAAGKPIEGVTWAVIHDMNAKHASDQAKVSKDETLELLQRNSAEAADRVRRMTDDQLDSAAPVSLNGGAPLTAQFFIEDHALRHSFHHLAKIRETLSA